ncbi:MAG: hypothetical protein AAGB93_11595 [Planctomycetota bacterium]
MFALISLALPLAAQSPEFGGPASFEAFRGNLATPLRVGLVRGTKKFDLDLFRSVVESLDEDRSLEFVFLDGWGSEGRRRAVDLNVDVAAVVRSGKIVQGRTQAVSYGPIGSKSGQKVKYTGLKLDLSVDLEGVLDASQEEGERDWVRLARWKLESDRRKAPRSFDPSKAKGGEYRSDPAAAVLSVLRWRLESVGATYRPLSIDTPPDRLAEWYRQLPREAKLEYWQRTSYSLEKEPFLPYDEILDVALEDWKALYAERADEELVQRIRLAANGILRQRGLCVGDFGAGRALSPTDLEEERRVIERRSTDWKPKALSQAIGKKPLPYVVLDAESCPSGLLVGTVNPRMMLEHVFLLPADSELRDEKPWRTLAKKGGAGVFTYSRKKIGLSTHIDPEEVTAENVASLLVAARPTRWPRGD